MSEVLTVKNEFYIERSGERLHCIEWRPEGEVRAVLQIVHGMVEYIDRYDAFATYLCERGIAVVGHDHPGHGMTAQREEDLGFIRRGDGDMLLVDCILAVTEYIKENYKGKRCFIFGHSMGSFAVRKYITAHSELVDGALIVGTGTPHAAVLSAGRALAGIICKLFGERHRSRLLTNMSFSGYNSRFPKEEGVHAWISGDREVVKRYDSDPFCTYIFTAAGFCALYDTLLFLAKRTDSEKIRKNLPMLIASGAVDPFGSYGKWPEEYADHCKSIGISDVTLRLFEGQRHEIINEKDKEKVFEELYCWIADRI